MNKKILITGFSGFVATHFVEYLYNNHNNYEIIGIDLNKPSYNYNKFEDRLKISFYKVDLLNREYLFDILGKVKPDYILHLAAYSSVAFSWEHPEESFINNSNIFLNLIHVIQKVNPSCRVLSVGSSEEYGNVAHENIPIRENQLTNPLSPYAVARVSQELLSKVYVNAYNMNIVMTRSFNHIGPRQDCRFVVPSFITRILDIKNSGDNSGIIYTGNTDIIRDFVDVRDVVKAYYILLIQGTSGETYNICSGKGIRLRELIQIISEEVGINVCTKVDPKLIRPNDNMEIVGTYYKIETELGWKPEIKIRKTIQDMIEYYNK